MRKHRAPLNIRCDLFMFGCSFSVSADFFLSQTNKTKHVFLSVCLFLLFRMFKAYIYIYIYWHCRRLTVIFKLALVSWCLKSCMMLELSVELELLICAVPALDLKITGLSFAVINTLSKWAWQEIFETQYLIWRLQTCHSKLAYCLKLSMLSVLWLFYFVVLIFILWLLISENML